MRLSWPFRRHASDGAAAAAAVGPVQRAEAPVRHDWRAAGTLGPTFVGDPGIRLQRFPAEIAGSQPPPPILAPLGHARTADGPAGLVSGLARPTLAPATAGLAGRAELPLRARRPAPTIQRATTDADVEPPTGPGVVIAVERAATGPGPSQPDPLPETLPAFEPRRASVATTVAPRPGPLTIARTPDFALAPARGASSGPVVASRQAAPIDPVGPSAIAGSPAGAPTRTILRTPGGSRVRLGPPVDRATLAAGTPSLDLAPTAGSATPVGATVPTQRHEAQTHQPSADATDAPLAGGLATTIDDQPMGGLGQSVGIAAGAPRGLVLARVVAAPAPPSEAPMGSDAPLPDAPAAAPLVGVDAIGPTTSLRPTIPVAQGPAPGAQDAVAGRSSATRTSSVGRSASRPARPAATAHGSSTAHETSTAQRTTAQAATAQRAAIDSIPATRRVAAIAGAPMMAAPLVPTAVTRSATMAEDRGRRIDVLAPVQLPMPATGEAPTVLRLARSASTVVAPTNDLRPSRPPEPGATPVATMQRAPADLPATTPDEALPADGTTSTTSPSGGTVTTSTGAPPAPGAAIGDRDLDEMVRRLYPRLRRSLSSELLVARERAGTLADLR